MDDQPVETNVANWVGSGMYLTSPASFLRFYHRGMCQIAHHLSRQIGDGAKIEIDYRKFAECFTMVDKHGTRHQPEFWELHPGSTATSTEFGCTRQEAADLWDVWNDDRSLYLPHSAHQKVVKMGTIHRVLRRSHCDPTFTAAQQQEGPSKRKGKRKQTHDDDPQADDAIPSEYSAHHAFGVAGLRSYSAQSRRNAKLKGRRPLSLVRLRTTWSATLSRQRQRPTPRMMSKTVRPAYSFALERLLKRTRPCI